MANPFLDLPRDDLADELSTAALRLGERRASTAEERAAFAERLRLLLIAAANRLASGQYTPGEPAFEIARSAAPDPVAVYQAWIRRQALSARYTAISQLAEAVMPPHALTGWLEARPRALDDDAACAAALAELVELKRLPRHRRAGG